MTDPERAEYDDVVRQLMAKCEQLAAENARLRSSENNAHSVLREVYNDPTASPAIRVKAAGLALAHETPRLQSVPPPIDAACEEIVEEPLADVARRHRAHGDRMAVEMAATLERDLKEAAANSQSRKRRQYRLGQPAAFLNGNGQNDQDGE